MIAKLLSLYRKKQIKDAYKAFSRNAMIGQPFEIERTAEIVNESGDPKGIIIGHHCRVCGVLYCKSTGRIEIGNYSTIQNWAELQCVQNIKIGHYSVISERTIVTDNNNHRIEPEERIKHRIRVAPGGPGYPGSGDGWELSDSAPVIIEDVVWIGANCLILKGVTVGEGSIVARSSVVTKDVPPYTIVAGNPAKIVKKIDRPNYKYYKV